MATLCVFGQGRKQNRVDRVGVMVEVGYGRIHCTLFFSYVGISLPVRIPARILFLFTTTYIIHIPYVTFLAVDVPIILAASPILGISLYVERVSLQCIQCCQITVDFLEIGLRASYSMPI